MEIEVKVIGQREWCERGIENAKRTIAKDEADLKRARGFRRTILKEGIASMLYLIGQYEAELASIPHA